jgi:hypothetical protein
MRKSRDDHDGPPSTLIPVDGDIGTTGLTGNPVPPPAPSAELRPDQLERYVLAGVHHDRAPGNLLVVLHPLKKHKVPRPLFDALRSRGFAVHVVETQPDLASSVDGIRARLVELSEDDVPLDLMVISGDGSLDHHVMVAAYSAFHPELVEHRPGRVDCSEIGEEELSRLPPGYHQAFFRQGLPADVEPTQENVTRVWLLRSRLEKALRRGREPEKIARMAGLGPGDPILGIAILATLWPQRVTLLPEHYDLTKLAEASQEDTFQGLYPWIRALACYPAGVAADNAVFAGVPGWGFATVGKMLARFGWLDPLRRRLEAVTTRRFVEYFCDTGVVVPARLSVLAIDGHWRAICGHVVSGPAGGHFFTKDLTKKTQTMWGYLMRIPAVILKEGVFGRTRVRLQSFDARGRTKSYTEGHLAEGLYTNRTYVAGVASVPTTTPTSYAGESSLLVVPPVWNRESRRRIPVTIRGLLGFGETILKGLVSRALHFFGFGTGTLAGGGRVWGLLPEHQVAIKEGESIQVDYQHLDGTPRGVPVVISGDPFQAHRLDIRVLWGPVPMLGGRRSLIVAATRKTLSNVRMEQSYDLEHTYIGGVRYFRHRTGKPWSPEMSARTGLFLPPLHLPRTLTWASERLTERWEAAGAGEFIDTSKPGLPLARKGCFAHNNDQTAHLLVLKQPGGMLLVRQVRARHGEGLFETRTDYRLAGVSYIIVRSQTIAWGEDDEPRILREAHYFRDAEAFQRDAAAFLPIVGTRIDPAPTDGDESVAGTPDAGE